jgi:hypothetical protein
MFLRFWIFHLCQLKTDLLDVEIFVFEPNQNPVDTSKSTWRVTATATDPHYLTRTRDVMEVKQVNQNLKLQRET